MLFLGVEILSIPVYIMAGSNRRLSASNESALKYFLMGSFASGILLFGIALVYGATQTLDLDQMALLGRTVQSPLFTVGVLLVLCGFLFKIAAAPFHFWAPDVYEGAPGLVTAFMATIVKTAAFAAFFRLFSTAFISEESAWFKALWGITAATLLAGNLTALYQTKMKRLMAYSSIAHAGYMLLAMLTLNKQAGSAVLLYAASYTLASIAVFAVMLLVSEAQESDALVKFNGLAKNNPFLAVILAIALFSLAGIPPLAGFFAKYYLFAIALKSNLFYIVIVAIIASIIGAWYYLKSLSLAFMPSNEAAEHIPVGLPTKIVLILCVTGALVLGLRPDLILHLI
jgi:NADH-quinone oxidoreductase subunit N